MVTRIAHILPWPKIGGTEIATLRIVQSTEGDEFKNIAFCMKGANLVRDLFRDANIETAEYSPAERSYRHPMAYLKESFRLARELRRRKVHIVHCADLLSGLNFGLAGRLAALPVLCHIRCRFNPISRRDQSFLSLINKFAFVSKATWLNFGYHVAQSRGTVLYDGIDTAIQISCEEARNSVRAEFGIPPGAKIVGIVARVAPVKDYVTLIKAAAQVVKLYPDVRFLAVGECSGDYCGKHFATIKEVLESHNLISKFIFTDYRPDVTRLISAMDIFVLSTHSEGMPLAILEAMIHQKPVLATAVDGIPEIVLDQKTGLLNAHEDAVQLATNLLTLLHDEEYAVRLGINGRRFVEANFSRGQFAKGLAELYRGLHPAHKGRAGKEAVEALT